MSYQVEPSLCRTFRVSNGSIAAESYLPHALARQILTEALKDRKNICRAALEKFKSDYFPFHALAVLALFEASEEPLAFFFIDPAYARKQNNTALLTPVFLEESDSGLNARLLEFALVPFQSREQYAILPDWDRRPGEFLKAAAEQIGMQSARAVRRFEAETADVLCKLQSPPAGAPNLRIVSENLNEEAELLPNGLRNIGCHSICSNYEEGKTILLIAEKEGKTIGAAWALIGGGADPGLANCCNQTRRLGDNGCLWKIMSIRPEYRTPELERTMTAAVHHAVAKRFGLDRFAFESDSDWAAEISVIAGYKPIFETRDSVFYRRPQNGAGPSR